MRDYVTARERLKPAKKPEKMRIFVNSKQEANLDVNGVEITIKHISGGIEIVYPKHAPVGDKNLIGLLKENNPC